ncbi:MAG TPA: class I SAM-dependent methyltransferase [Mycobacteriales bacterium]|nr:class I SAM-dependent methyltransferase [Mycobacteriales bacterium]
MSESQDQAHPLALTGERTLPGIAVENYWFRRHEAAYDAIDVWCRGATVFEAGCGEGYGAHSLARTASKVIGLDYDEAAVQHVAGTYSDIRVVRGNLAQLPVRTGAIDVVVNLQVIEHLWDQPAFLAETARVLRPGGTLLLSTPNRLTFSPGQTAPLNPFHTRELSADELSGLLADAGFSMLRLYGVWHGRRLRRLDKRHGGSLIDAQLAGPAATWHPSLRADVASVRAADFDIRTDDIDNSLDLLAIAVQPG